MNWTRVTKRNRCPICNKDHWCSFTEDGRSVKCMRVSSDRTTKDGGFLHAVGNGRAFHYVSTTAKTCQPAIKSDRMLAGWQAQQNGELVRFSSLLGVSRMALESLGCVYAAEHRAFAFPMRDANRDVIGIRLRNDLGKKWAVTGSKQGLFLGADTELTESRSLGQAGKAAENQTVAASTTLIVEGPTDAAAAIDLGFNVIGRPACLGCEGMIAEVVHSGNVTTLYIVADNDDPGQRGAAKLQQLLYRSKIITLPCKDLREFKSQGGTKELLNALLCAAV